MLFINDKPTRLFFTLCRPSLFFSFFFRPDFSSDDVARNTEYQLWFDICPGTAGVLKAERHSINPMRNMFTGKQNVINPAVYKLIRSKTETSRNLAHICFS